jgi:p-aminobenzoyl-glutamate transporter AbgT
MVVEVHPLADPVSRFAAVRIGFQVNLLITSVPTLIEQIQLVGWL